MSLNRGKANLGKGHILSYPTYYKYSSAPPLTITHMRPCVCKYTFLYPTSPALPPFLPPCLSKQNRVKNLVDTYVLFIILFSTEIIEGKSNVVIIRAKTKSNWHYSYSLSFLSLKKGGIVTFTLNECYIKRNFSIISYTIDKPKELEKKPFMPSKKMSVS